MGSTPKFRLRLFGQIPFRQKKIADFFLFLQRFSSSPRRREAADNGVGALQKTLFYVLKVLLYSRSRQKQGTQVPPLGRLCTDLISFPFHRSFRAAACGTVRRRVSQSQNILFLISIFYDTTKEVHFLPRMECRGACRARSGANPSVQKRLARIVHHGRQPQRHAPQPSVCRR